MVETLSEFHCLFGRDGTIDSSQYFLNRSFASAVNKRSYIKRFPWVLQDLFCNGTGRFTKYIRKHFIQLEIGDSKTVMRAILLTGDHTGEFETVSYQIS